VKGNTVHQRRLCRIVQDSRGESIVNEGGER